MRNNALTNQSPVVSLADAAAKLRQIATEIRFQSCYSIWEDHAAQLDALASSLEQLQPGPAITDAERKALERAAGLLEGCDGGDELQGLLDRLTTGANTNSDQVTITLSRIHAEDVASWVRAKFRLESAKWIAGQENNAAHWEPISETLDAALQPQPHPKERRE